MIKLKKQKNNKTVKRFFQFDYKPKNSNKTQQNTEYCLNFNH
jgi:hypothetical protein